MTVPKGRVLAVDLGDVRVGVAVSDPLGVTAQPLPTIPARIAGGAVGAVAALIGEHGAGEVVVGLPLLMSGEEGERARLARSFARRLSERVPGVVVTLWDERLSSVEAERRMGEGGVRSRDRRGRVDAVAAALILQSYLDARP